MGLSALRRTIIATEAFMLQEATQLGIPRVAATRLAVCVAAAMLFRLRRIAVTNRRAWLNAAKLRGRNASERITIRPTCAEHLWRLDFCC